MLSRPGIQHITRDIIAHAHSMIAFPRFKPWSLRHAHDNNRGVMKAKVSLLLAFLDEIAGGDEHDGRVREVTT